MIIVSQDKTSLVNYDNISCIEIYPPSDDTQNYEINAEKVDGGLTELGIYETEERAKEVLNEISDAIESWEDLKAGQPSGIPSFKYCMPEE